MTRDHLHNVLWGATALVAWLAAFVFLWSLRPLDPVTKLELVIEGPIHAGGDLRVHIDYCKTEGFAPSSVSWALIDGVTIMLEPMIVRLTPGCHVTTLIMPSTPHMIPGTYKLHVDGVYPTYPWRAYIIKSATSPEFEVVP